MPLGVVQEFNLRIRVFAKYHGQRTQATYTGFVHWQISTSRSGGQSNEVAGEEIRLAVTTRTGGFFADPVQRRVYGGRSSCVDGYRGRADLVVKASSTRGWRRRCQEAKLGVEDS